MLDRVVMVISG